MEGGQEPKDVYGEVHGRILLVIEHADDTVASNLVHHGQVGGSGD